MPIELEIMPIDAIKLVEACYGYISSNRPELYIQSLWRTKDNIYLIDCGEKIIYPV